MIPTKAAVSGHGDIASSSPWLPQTSPKRQKQTKELGNERSQQGCFPFLVGRMKAENPRGGPERWLKEAGSGCWCLSLLSRRVTSDFTSLP